MAQSVLRLPDAARLLERAGLRKRMQQVAEETLIHLQHVGEVEGVETRGTVQMQSQTGGTIRLEVDGSDTAAMKRLRKLVDEEIVR